MVHVLSWEGRFKTCSKHWENKAVSDLFQIWIYIKKSDKVAGRWDVLSRTVRISGLLGVLWFVFFFFLAWCCGPFRDIMAKFTPGVIWSFLVLK